MTRAAQIMEAMPSLPSGWIRAVDAASRLGVSCGHFRRLCKDRYAGTGLARKHDGDWIINKVADQRLADFETWQTRDARQIGELQNEGHGVAAIERAEAIRSLVQESWDFKATGHGEEAQFREFINHLHATGRLPNKHVHKLKPRTLRGWRDSYRRLGLRGLVRKPYPDRGSVLGAAALGFILNLTLGGNRITLAQAVVLCRGEAAKHGADAAWRMGSYSSIRIAIKARSPKILRTLADKGPRAARADCVPKIPRDFEAIAAGNEYCGDERTVDVWCRVLTARGWRAVRGKLTTWLDMRSRMIVGCIFAPHANSRTILGALKLAIRDHGKPAILRTDWGEDYKKAAKHGILEEFNGERIGGVLEELRIEVHRTAAPYTPYAKPIESFFRGMKEHLDKLFAGFWGGCPSERHEDRAKYLRDNLEKLPTVDDVAASIAAWLDIYHRTPHSAPDLFGKSPLEAMAAFRSGPIRTETPEVLDHLFQEFIGPRLVRRDGVRWNGRWYGNGDARLVPLQDQKVLLGIQPEDQGRAMVCKPDRTPLFEVECLQISGRTREEIAEMQKARQRMMRPYIEQARAARDFLRATNPRELLDLTAAGITAMHGDRRGPAEPPPRLTVVRPALQEAISTAGRAPSESASRAVRTGTDDEITTADLLDTDDTVCVAEPSAHGGEDDLDFFGLDDVGGDA